MWPGMVLQHTSNNLIQYLPRTPEESHLATRLQLRQGGGSKYTKGQAAGCILQVEETARQREALEQRGRRDLCKSCLALHCCALWFIDCYVPTILTDMSGLPCAGQSHWQPLHASPAPLCRRQEAAATDERGVSPAWQHCCNKAQYLDQLVYVGCETSAAGMLWLRCLLEV